MQEPPYRVKNMMPGMIMLWYGSVATIPSGWHLCDGTMGTPDLEAKFVIGAGVFPGPGATGGSDVHNHDFTGDGHAHDLVAGDYIADVSPNGDYGHETSIQPASGTTANGNNIPSYHALCYIMKL